LIFLDTNICIYVMRQMSAALVEKFEQESHRLHVSTVVIAELEFGVINSKHQAANALRLEQLVAQLRVVDWNHACARAYAHVRHATRAQPISSEDTMIAACAIAHDATLVTNNLREFLRVPELRVENWIDPG
jgi:tRNA(fMet)-specific endonuclease VapC